MNGVGTYRDVGMNCVFSSGRVDKATCEFINRSRNNLQPWMCTREGSFQAPYFYLKHVKAGHCRAIQLFLFRCNLLANNLNIWLESGKTNLQGLCKMAKRQSNVKFIRLVAAAAVGCSTARHNSNNIVLGRVAVQLSSRSLFRVHW